MIVGFQGQVDQLKSRSWATDIYLERYLPVASLNMMRDVCEEAFGEYEDKRKFLELVKDKFEKLQKTIYDYEIFDSQMKEETRYKMTLQKREYNIPAIRIPVTITNSVASEDQSN